MLDVITEPCISTKHGFFTRRGGVSDGIYKGLNCGLGSGDDRVLVEQNRARVAQWMNAPLQTAHQYHSADVITVTQPHTPQRADSLVTRQAGIALGVLTADCQPVLFHDANAQVIGAAHAGWKGAQTGVLEATITAMEALGANRHDINVVIGPCISQAAYEVGPEFLERFTARTPMAERHFQQGTGDRFLFDMPGYSLARLAEFGVGTAMATEHCTYGAPARFYSYRRSVHKGEADYGRLIACITL